MQYDAFGIEIESYDETNQFANPFGYAGEYTDEETGNIYLRARYYDPNTGRFMSEDPIQDGTNWYIYAGNNPVLYIDPWGLWMPGDEKLSQEAQFAIQYYTRKWEDADTPEEQAAAHAGAQAVREGVGIEGVWYDVPHYSQGEKPLCQYYVTVMIENTFVETPMTQEEADERVQEIVDVNYPVDYQYSIKPDTIGYDILFDALNNYGPQSAIFKHPQTGTHSIVVTGVLRVNGEVLIVSLNPQDKVGRGTGYPGDYGTLIQDHKYSVISLDEFPNKYTEGGGAGFEFKNISVKNNKK